jgi:hypothetical protein
MPRVQEAYSEHFSLADTILRMRRDTPVVVADTSSIVGIAIKPIND